MADPSGAAAASAAIPARAVQFLSLAPHFIAVDTSSRIRISLPSQSPAGLADQRQYPPKGHPDPAIPPGARCRGTTGAHMRPVMYQPPLDEKRHCDAFQQEALK